MPESAHQDMCLYYFLKNRHFTFSFPCQTDRNPWMHAVMEQEAQVIILKSRNQVAEF
jgi:hypothetical protein